MRRLARAAIRAGFVQVLDERTLLLPDRPGNRLADSLRNVLENPHVALLFFVPGVTDTFRVNGRATIVDDPELLEPCAVEGKVPKLGLLIEVEEAYTHCSKAFLRSQLWDPERYVDRSELPSPGELLRSVGAEVEPDSTTRSAPSGTSAAKGSTDRVPVRRLRATRSTEWEAGRELYLEAHVPGAAFLGDRALRPLDRGPGAAPAAA